MSIMDTNSKLTITIDTSGDAFRAAPHLKAQRILGKQVIDWLGCGAPYYGGFHPVDGNGNTCGSVQLETWEEQHNLSDPELMGDYEVCFDGADVTEYADVVRDASDESLEADFFRYSDVVSELDPEALGTPAGELLVAKMEAVAGEMNRRGISAAHR